MKWSKTAQEMLKDPTNIFNANSGVGVLHCITLTDSLPDRENFEFKTMMFVPHTLDKVLTDASLTEFYKNAEEQLLKKHKNWAGRTKVEAEPLTRFITN